jgi:hypothetical protein
MESGGLSMLNAQLAAVGELPEEIWHEWLWGTDPEEPYHMDVLLNRNQLLALLVCRYKHLNCTEARDLGGGNGFSQGNRMTIMEKPVHSMTWRELKDTMANVLFEWPAFLDRLRHNIRAKHNLRQVLHLVNLCAARFGALAYMAAGEEILDDPSETQPSTDRTHTAGMMMLTSGALRRMAGSLLIMYRHLHLLAVCVKVQPQNYEPGISKYHYEASNDAFNLLCMHISLPVAARLNYRHDFPGMYNHVSQVVYFHNSQYIRTARHPLQDLKNASAIHVLPAIQELFPEIPLKFEEEKFDPSKGAEGWYWLLLAGRIYLVTPEPRVLFSENVADLLKVYIDSTARP